MASTPVPVTSAIATGPWGRPVRPAEKPADGAPAGWDVTPVRPPPPVPVVTVRGRHLRRAMAEVAIATALMAVLASTFGPDSTQPPAAVAAVRMAVDLASLQAGSAGSAAKVRADLHTAEKVPPPRDPVAAAAWRYALSETAAGLRAPNQSPAAETALSSALQAVLLVEARQHTD